MANTEGVFRVTGLDKTIRSLHVDLQSGLRREDWEKVYEVLKVPLRKADELHLKGKGVPDSTKQKTLPRGTGELLGAIRAKTVSDKRGLRINVGFSISAIGKDDWGYWKGLRARFINTGTKVSGKSRRKAGVDNRVSKTGKPAEAQSRLRARYATTGRHEADSRELGTGTPLIEPQYFIYYSYRDELGEEKDAVGRAVNEAVYKVLMEKK